MTDPKRDPLRDIMSTSPAVSDELRARFDEQAKGLITGRITGSGRMGRIVAVTVLATFALLLAFALYIVYEHAVYQKTPLFQMLPHFVGYGAGFLLLGSALFQYVWEVRSGFVASRRMAKVTYAIRYGSAFLIPMGPALLLIGFDQSAPYPPSFIFLVTIFTAGLWLIIALLVLRRLARQYRDDIIVEQKRTQWEIALLRQDCAAKSGKA